MRKAIILKLKELESFNNIYEAFNAPENCSKPYATVKMYGDEEAPENHKGQKDGFSVTIHDDPDSFKTLDSLVWEVRDKLDGVTLTADDGTVFVPEYIKTLEDYHDDIKNLFSKRIDFDFAGVRI